ncbi:MAG: nucleotidyl transferase AbiEii/AbiGii toxin family protein [Fusobacteriaceae bacterium]|jgi:predicted nucleotidyltransferase component of viral defense system|nr:nucleotidyl transferase AbiEii/AbiGii toxin family protein [Fusobacteriaceae bacterium]
MKTSTQLKALVRNLSKEKNVNAEIILRNFMLERFLERVSFSKYSKNFILKGGMLIAAIVGMNTRTTMDMDVTIKGKSLTEAQIKEIFEDILSVSIKDNVVFSYRKIEEMREEAEYPGYRVSIDALLDKTRQIMHIDITTGDFITPGEIEYSYKLMFENRSISIFAYNLETVLAEKFETIVSRGVTNSRMRDFYDIYVLTGTQKIDADTFRMALVNTSKKRGTFTQMADASTSIQRIATSQVLIDLWNRYQKNYSYAADLSWEMAVNSLRKLNETL